MLFLSYELKYDEEHARLLNLLESEDDLKFEEDCATLVLRKQLQNQLFERLITMKR